MESWLSEEISNAEVFRADYTTFRRDTLAVVVFICVKNYITFAEQWVDEVYEMIAVEIKGKGPNIMLEIVGLYRVPNEDMRLLEKLADWAGYMRTTKHSIIGGDLNLFYADWNSHVEKSRGTQVFLKTGMGKQLLSGSK
jgi:hypothetical protein